MAGKQVLYGEKILMKILKRPWCWVFWHDWITRIRGEKTLIDCDRCGQRDLLGAEVTG